MHDSAPGTHENDAEAHSLWWAGLGLREEVRGWGVELFCEFHSTRVWVRRSRKRPLPSLPAQRVARRGPPPPDSVVPPNRLALRGSEAARRAPVACALAHLDSACRDDLRDVVVVVLDAVADVTITGGDRVRHAVDHVRGHERETDQKGAGAARLVRVDLVLSAMRGHDGVAAPLHDEVAVR